MPKVAGAHGIHRVNRINRKVLTNERLHRISSTSTIAWL